jgi:uncharacterized membrane protein
MFTGSTDLSSFEEKVGQFHPLVLHFPIVLFTATLVCDMWAYFRRLENYSAGTWLLVAGLISCAPTLLKGLAASAGMDPDDIILAKHRTLAFTTASFASFYVGLRIALMWWKVDFPGSFYVGLSIIMVALVTWTADYGGLITRPATPFNTRASHEVAHAEHVHGTHHH